MIRLKVLPEPYAVCRLPANARLPLEILELPFYSITRTSDELSLVVPESAAQAEWLVESGWRALKVLGPLDFSLIGILAQISTALSQAGVSLFALSTYDTDYILVRSTSLKTAVDALRAASCGVLEDTSSSF